MSKLITKFYYEQIKELADNAVDDFWNNTLPQYFCSDKSYGMELEQRSLEGALKRRADFKIRCIRAVTNKNTKKGFILIEDNRQKTEGFVWVDAIAQLSNYLMLVRTEQAGKNILYAAITTGTHIRFYYLEPGEQILRDYPSFFTGKAYELKNDENEVHGILNEYVAKTAH